MRTRRRATAHDFEPRQRALLQRFIDDRDGATTFEYLLVTAFVCFGVSAALRSLGSEMPGLFEDESQRLFAWQTSGASTPGASNAGSPAPPGHAQHAAVSPATVSPAAMSPATVSPTTRSSVVPSGGMYFGYDLPDPPPIDPYVAGAIDSAQSLARSASRRAVGGVYDLGDRLPDRFKDGPFRALELGARAADRASDFADRGLDRLPSGVKSRIPDSVKGAYGKAREVVDQVADVNFEAFRDDTGLKGDWYRFYDVWITESSPSDLGKWRGDSVTITDPAYTGDLASRGQHQASLALFFRKYGTDPSKFPPNASISTRFEYVAPNTVEGSTYGALESVLGSYRTTLVYRGIDPATGRAKFDVVVRNEARWASGTRLPESVQVGGSDHVVGDRSRNSGLGIGGDYSQRFEWSEQVDPTTDDVRVGVNDQGIASGDVTVCADDTLESDCTPYSAAPK